MATQKDILANLPPRKRKYLLNVAKGMKKFDAAVDAGYSASVAVSAKGKLENADYQEAFAALMRQKIPASKIIKRINDGLDATETKYFADKGVVKDYRDVIAWGERRKYAALAAQMSDRYHEKRDVRVNRHLSEETVRTLLELSSKLGMTSLPDDEKRKLLASHVPLTLEAPQEEAAE